MWRAGVESFGLANPDAGCTAYESSCEGSKCQYDPCHFDTHGITSDPSFSALDIVDRRGIALRSEWITRPGPLHKPVLSRCRSFPIPNDRQVAGSAHRPQFDVQTIRGFGCLMQECFSRSPRFRKSCDRTPLRNLHKNTTDSI